MLDKLLSLKQKIVKLYRIHCLANISKDFSISNATGLHGYVYHFSVDYKAIADDKIHDIHRYLIKKTRLYKIFRVMKKILAITFLVSNVNSLKCVSIKNQECKGKMKK